MTSLFGYESMAAELDNLGLRGEFYAVLGYCESGFGTLDQAVKTSTKAAKLCEAAGNREAAGYAMYISAIAHLFRADYEQALTSG